MGPRCVCMLLALLLTVPCAAQEAPADSYKEHRDQATKLYHAGRYEEAIEEMKAAYAILPDASILLNLGHASLRARRPEEALRYYRRYGERAEELRPDERKDLARYIERARIAAEQARARALIAQTRSGPVPLYRRWWFWGAMGMVIAGSVAGIVAGTISRAEPPPEIILRDVFPPASP